MLVSKEEMQKRRSPRELREFAETVRAAVRAEPAEFNLGMTKSGLYKEFLDEVIPLSYFAEHYPANYTIEPKLSSQGYDAIVYDDTGAEFERVEITKPHDGKEADDDAKLVINRGYGQTKAGNPADDFDALLPLVVSTCECKALKDYSDCTLIVAIFPLPAFIGYEDRYEEKILKLVSCLSKIAFNAKRVVLYIHPNRVEEIMG